MSGGDVRALPAWTAFRGGFLVSLGGCWKVETSAFFGIRRGREFGFVVDY